MKIQSYKFGKLKIDGLMYESDLILTAEEIHENWQRQSSHRLQMADLDPLLALNPTRLIIGTGFMGLLQVDEEVFKALRQHDIKFHVMKTKRALRTFRSYKNKENVVVALHLTC